MIVRERSPLAPALAAVNVFLALFATCVQAQGDGPRAYFPSPVNSSAASVYGQFMTGDQSEVPGTVTPGSHVDVDIGNVEYWRSFEVNGFLAGVYANLPFGRVSGRLNLGPLHYAETSSGVGDLELGMTLNLIGAPPLSGEQWAAYKPGFALDGLFKAYAPTGAYSSSNIFNLGTHRWAFELGAPMAYYVGESLDDLQLTTFELLPSVTFFTDNNAPFHAGTQAQAPLYGVELHVTRNLNQTVWVSLDGGWEFGGETTTDGVKDGNSQRALGLGGTIGVNLSASASLNITYGGTLSHNAAGSDANFLRVTFTYSF